MRKITRPLPVIVFALLCLLPLALFTINGPWPGGGKIRLQPRAPFPAKITPRVFRGVDQWFDSRIGLRLPLLSAGVAFHTGLLRRSTDRRVVIGRDGWLFYTDGGDETSDSLADFHGLMRLSDAQVKNIARRAVTMHDALAACGIASLIVIGPNKQSIYGEYLKHSAARSKTRFDDLLERMDPQARKMFLDLRPPLLAAKQQDKSLPLYFKTDTHWNQLGAFYAYRAIIQALAQTMPVSNLSQASLDRFTIDVQPFGSGDLNATMLSAPEWFADLQVMLKRKPVGKAGDAVSPAQGRMLLIGDSFSYSLENYFPPHFAAFRLVTRDSVPADPWPGREKPTAVVFEIVERNLSILAKWQFDWSQFCQH